MNTSTVIAQAQSLLQAQNYSAAIPLLSQAIKKAPKDPNIWFMLGIAQGSSNELPAAEKAFQRVVDLVPSAHAAWENLGRVQMKLGNMRQAERSIRKSIAIQPNNPTAYATLGELQRNCGNIEASMQALRNSLSQAPDVATTHNQMGATLELSGALPAAIEHYQKAVALAPAFFDARYNLATALYAHGQYEAAVPLYQQCTQQQPDSIIAWHALADCLLDMSHSQEALQLYKQILQRAPQTYTAHLRIARILIKQNDMHHAQQHIDKAQALRPIDDPDVCAQRAEFAILKGNLEDARAVLSPALDAHPHHLPLALAEALLEERTNLSPAVIAKLESIRDALPLAPEDLHFALGRLYERSGQFSNAFAAFEAAHARRGLASDLTTHLQQIDRIEAFFSRERLAGLPRTDSAEQLPIFIVGMPRSGTSLAEQILASHPRIYGAGETTKLSKLLSGLTHQKNKTYPEGLENLSITEIDRCAADYLAHLREYSNDAERICDKLPHNFLHLGAIQLLFPRATVIHCRRDPLDTCLSIFALRFNAAHRYAQHLEDLGRYYLRYQQLMAHWERTLDIRIHTLDYENLITDQEGESRRLIAATGLDWDDACLRFYDSGRTVVTPSYDQVRQPLYRTSVNRWKNFEPQLQPLRKILGS